MALSLSLSLSSSQRRSTDVREMIFFKRVKRHQRSRTVIVIRALPHYMYCIRSLHFASSSTNAIHLFAKRHDILNINLGQIYSASTDR